jgi:hypothetical protein
MMINAASPISFFFRTDRMVSTLAIAVEELGIVAIEALRQRCRRHRMGFDRASTIAVAEGSHPFEHRLACPSYQAIVHTYLTTFPCLQTIAVEELQSRKIVAIAVVQILPAFAAGTSFVAASQAAFEIGR